MSSLFLIAAGRILISAVMGLPAARRMSVRWLGGWFIDLFHCPFCLGTWLYFILFCFFHFELFTWAGLNYIPVVSEAISGGVVSWAVHMFTTGFKTIYFTYEG